MLYIAAERTRFRHVPGRTGGSAVLLSIRDRIELLEAEERSAAERAAAWRPENPDLEPELLRIRSTLRYWRAVRQQAA